MQRPHRYSRARFNTIDKNISLMEEAMKDQSEVQLRQKLPEFFKTTREELDEEDRDIQAKINYLMQKDAQVDIISDFRDLIGGLRHSIAVEAGGYTHQAVKRVLRKDGAQFKDWQLLQKLYAAGRGQAHPHRSITHDDLRDVVATRFHADKVLFGFGIFDTDSYEEVNVKPLFSKLVDWASKRNVPAVAPT
jgi:hypothetical protein